MANNIDFITSISKESDFEELVRRVAKYIYGAEAYLIGGPYDGGRDLCYKRAGREVREAVQITIQATSIETKILSDAIKTKDLVATFAYPERLTVFISHSLSASRKLKIKKKIRDETGIELEIYDATEIEQIITEDEPEILHYLISEVHKYDPKNSGSIDPKARAFYDYLALGKDAADLKGSIIDSQILSSLFESPKDESSFIEEIQAAGVKKGVAMARTSNLIAAGKVVRDSGKLSLDVKEALRIDNILKKDEANRIELLARLKDYTEKATGRDLSIAALELIKQVYRASIEIQISETSFEPPKLKLVKDLVHKLEFLLVNEGGVIISVAKDVAKELIEIGAQNEYLSNQCSSLLCVNLLSQKKLDKYIRERNFFVYFDATVFIRYLALFNFKSKNYLDKDMRITEQLRDAVKGLKNCRLFITREHLEETVRHITQAEKISRFANDALIQRFGESKNVYFNLYLQEKSLRKNYTFDDFLEQFIGYEKDPKSHASGYFDAYLTCVQRFNRLANISVVENVDELESDPIARRISGEYESWTARIGKSRKHRTAFNDVIACYVLSDDRRHLDDLGYGHAPMFVTWDSTQHQLRDFYRMEFPFAEWLIYSPQRAIERLSMVNFNVQGDIIKDSVLALLEEDYVRDSSLIDALAAFFGEDQIETDAVISLLNKLSGRMHNEVGDSSHFEVNERSLISDALLTIQNTFRDRFDEVRRFFTNPSEEEAILDVLTRFSAEKIDKAQLADEFIALVGGAR